MILRPSPRAHDAAISPRCSIGRHRVAARTRQRSQKFPRLLSTVLSLSDEDNTLSQRTEVTPPLKRADRTGPTDARTLKGIPHVRLFTSNNLSHLSASCGFRRCMRLILRGFLDVAYRLLCFVQLQQRALRQAQNLDSHAFPACSTWPRICSCPHAVLRDGRAHHHLELLGHQRVCSR